MIYLIALICFVLPSYLIRFSIFGVPTTLLEVLIYVAAILTIISKLKTQNSKPQVKIKNLIPNSKFLIPVALFLLSGIISIFIAPDKREALGLFKAYIFDPILFFWIIFGNIKDNKGVEWIIKGLIAGGAIVAIHAICQKLTGQVTIDGRVLGIFGYEASASPNYLALYLAPIAVLTFVWEYLIFSEKYSWENYKKVWFYDLALLAMLIALWFSGSRAAIGAVIIGIISYFVIKYWNWIKSKKIVFLFLCFSVLLLALLGWQFIKPDWQATPESGRLASSNNIRWEIWKTTVKDIIPENNNWLLGVGLGNYQNYFTEMTKDRVNFPEWIAPMALTPHNLFLTIWMNLGFLGLIAFVWLLVLFFFRNWKLEIGNYPAMLSAAMIVIVIHGLVDTPYWKNDLSVLFWILLASAISVNKSENNYAKN